MAAEPAEKVLEELLEVAALDPAARPVFIRALLLSEIYVLGAIGEDGNSLDLVDSSDPEGSVVAMFSSTDTLARTLEAFPDVEPHCVHLPCLDLWRMSPQSRYVLNPHGPCAKMFYPEEVQALLEDREPGLSEMNLDGGLEVEVGALDEAPAALVDVLSRFFADRPHVLEARLSRARFPQHPEGLLLTVVSADTDAALKGFGSLEVEVLSGGLSVDVVVESPEKAGSILWMVEPFYQAASAL